MGKTVVLDTNIYDELAADTETREALAGHVRSGAVQVLVTPKVRDELGASPFGGVPDWFPVLAAPETVAVLDHWRLGEAMLGGGETFTAHRGESKKTADAIIADSADTYADIVVSNDQRFRKRLAAISGACSVMHFAEFRAWLASQSRMGRRGPTTRY